VVLGTEKNVPSSTGFHTFKNPPTLSQHCYRGYVPVLRNVRPLPDECAPRLDPLCFHMKEEKGICMVSQPDRQSLGDDALVARTFFALENDCPRNSRVMVETSISREVVERLGVKIFFRARSPDKKRQKVVLHCTVLQLTWRA